VVENKHMGRKILPNVESFKLAVINAGGYTYKTAVAGSIS
jgi:hypothetical protein